MSAPALNDPTDEFIHDQLVDVLAPDGAPTASDISERSSSPWKPTDLGSADWAARKALAEHRKWETERAAVDAEIERLETWKAQTYRKRERGWSHWQGLLMGYHAEQVAADVRDNLNKAMATDKANDRVTKTIQLPCGVTLKRRAGGDKVEIVDKDAFLAAADDSLVRRNPDKTAIKNHITTTGEIPEGVQFVHGEASFSVSMPAADTHQ